MYEDSLTATTIGRVQLCMYAYNIRVDHKTFGVEKLQQTAFQNFTKRLKGMFNRPASYTQQLYKLVLDSLDFRDFGVQIYYAHVVRDMLILVE